jgi:hypothetical protein
LANGNYLYIDEKKLLPQASFAHPKAYHNDRDPQGHANAGGNRAAGWRDELQGSLGNNNGVLVSDVQPPGVAFQN